MTSPQHFKLIFNPTLKGAGETVDGEIQLNFACLMRDRIESVYVKLQGFVDTQIVRQITPNVDGRSDQRVELVDQSVCVWRQDDRIYPPTGSDSLKLSFTFKLPDELLPSFECGKRGSSGGRVRYSVQGFGKRSTSTWRGDPSIIMPFPVLPAHSFGAELRERLKQGWRGSWRSFSQEKDIRRGIWGEHSHVMAKATIPKLDTLPVLAPIPYTLMIVTHSKYLRSSEKDLGSVFPSLPRPEMVDFWVENDASFRARAWAAAINKNAVAHLGGLGSSGTANNVTKVDSVHVQTADRVWIPAEEDKKDERGRWKQEVVFSSTFFLNCAPSFESATLNVKHRLRFRVHFAGIGNALDMEIPVKIISSIYPLAQRAWDGPSRNRSTSHLLSKCGMGQ